MFDRRWRTAAVWAFAVTAALLAIFWSTAASVVQVWLGSRDYAYGFFILPTTAYLIWASRGSLEGMEPRPEAWALPVVAAMGAVWFAGRLTSLQFFSHYALLAMLIAASWAVFGTRVIRSIAFPLGFVIFAVPFGDVFVPSLVDITANLIVFACRLSTVPVVREASYILIPGGEFQVAETCAGLRFLTASVALGYAFTCLNYRSAIRRTLFVAASVGVALLANGLRAYSIVMIGYLSDMRSPLLKNHYAYGWFLYAAVILIFFALGARFRDVDAAPASGPSPGGGVPRPSASRRRVAAMTLAAVALAVPWAVVAGRVERAAEKRYHVQLPAPAPNGGWEPVAKSPWVLMPDFRGTDAELNGGYSIEDRGRYESGGYRVVSVFVAYYMRTRQGAELGGPRNAVVRSDDPTWKVTGEAIRTIAPAQRLFRVREMSLVGSDRLELKVWVWYWVAGRRTPYALVAKLYDAWGAIRGRPTPTAAFVVAAPEVEGVSRADRTLAEFAMDMLPSLEASLEAASIR